MTVIIALNDDKNNRVVLGSDKQLTIGNVKQVTDSKIVVVDIPIVDGYGETVRIDKCYIGIAGRFYMNNFIKWCFEAPAMPNNMKFIEYLHKYFLNDLREVLCEKNLTEEYNNQFESECDFIIVYNDEIYRIDSNFGVCAFDDYIVVGSGFREALGSLYTSNMLNSNIGAVKQVKLAIDAASQYNLYCDGESNITIIDY